MANHNHQKKIQNFPQESRYDLTKNRQHIGQHLKSLHPVNRFRKNILNQRYLPDRIEDAVDTICISQGKRNAQRFNHLLPPGEPQ